MIRYLGYVLVAPMIVLISWILIVTPIIELYKHNWMPLVAMIMVAGFICGLFLIDKANSNERN